MVNDPPRLRLDHVLLAVSDMEAATARLLDDHGLDSADSGLHPGLGTPIRVVPAGDAFLELVEIPDDPDALAQPLGRLLAAHRDALAGWTVATDDVAGEAERVGSRVFPTHRVMPDGFDLKWRMTGLDVAMAEPGLPAFVEWGEPAERHPARAPVQHRVGVEAFSWVEVAAPEARLAAWVDHAHLPVRVIGGQPPGVRRVAIATSAGEVVIG